MLSYPPLLKEGCYFEIEFAKGNTGTSAPTTTFLVGALVKYIYLFQHKKKYKKEKQGGKKVISEYNMETNKLHCCYYNRLVAWLKIRTVLCIGELFPKSTRVCLRVCVSVVILAHCI